MGLPACLQPQPGLAPFDVVPAGCVGFHVETDDADPILRRGDIAIVDTTDREPEHGGIFLIQWHSGGREIVEAARRMIGSGGHERPAWFTLTPNRPQPQGRAAVMAALASGRLTTSDGPYASADALAEKLVGRVTGILTPELLRRRELDDARLRAAGRAR